MEKKKTQNKKTVPFRSSLTEGSGNLVLELWNKVPLKQELMQRIVILCLKQEVGGDDPSDLMIHRGSVSWFYQKENTEVTQLQHVSELQWEKPEVLPCQSVLVSWAWAPGPAELRWARKQGISDWERISCKGTVEGGKWWICHFWEFWDQEWMRFWAGKRYFSAEVPVPFLSIHVKKNRSTTKGH